MDFRSSTVYQIYPKSFCDTNRDGFGDLAGVTEKLDYLKELGVDYIWLTPFYVSPQRDNGYDIEDYYNIDPRYGTMEDFEKLSAEAGRRGIRLMLDMVFNHVSSRHEWFRKAMDGDEHYKKYFFFRKGKGKNIPPTNWESKFGGSAWEYVEKFDEYYLHLFDVSQPDLNWDNEEVRQELRKVIRYWMAKGVKGFRFDVINLVSKGSFEDDPDGDGRRFYTDGPKIHEYLRELNEATFGQDVEIITVGEMSSTSMENCFRYAGEDGKELSMVFNFHHLKVDFMGNEKWVLVPADFGKLKQILFSWQVGMARHHAWNAVFWCNHDQPRVVSRFGDEEKYWKESAKMLGTVIHCMRGTPYIYQGEELGMTNYPFRDISESQDVEAIGAYRELVEEKHEMTGEQMMACIRRKGRDNARTPMQWAAGKNAGFTTGTPWMNVNPNHVTLHAQAQVSEPDSVFAFYQALIALRKSLSVVIEGDFTLLMPEDEQVFAYPRCDGHDTLLVQCNFSGKEARLDESARMGGRILLGNYDCEGPADRLRPWEARIWIR